MRGLKQIQEINIIIILSIYIYVILSVKPKKYIFEFLMPTTTANYCKQTRTKMHKSKLNAAILKSGLQYCSLVALSVGRLYRTP